MAACTSGEFELRARPQHGDMLVLGDPADADQAYANSRH
jgi:hypothetical protein